MRLLHTSDWHLGRSLHRADLQEAQETFLTHLVDTVRSERVDTVLVAGDVYDRAIPPVPAVAAFEDALVRLRDTGARVVVISGNHDSARRLGFGSGLVDAAGVHLRTRPAQVATPVLLEDRHGPVAVYGIPYLEPAAVRAELPPAPRASAAPSASAAPGAPEGTVPEAPATGADPLAGHPGVLGRATACIRADLRHRGSPRSVVLAHAWVSGGVASDSERDVSIGGVGSVPAALFDGFSYTALGHLHGPQVLSDVLRYSGSPLPYSFSEAAHRKVSWLVDLAADGSCRVEEVPAPVHRRLTVLRGQLEDLLARARSGADRDEFVSVTLTDAVRPQAAMARLQQLLPYVLLLQWGPEASAQDPRSYRTRVHGRDDLTVAAGFVEHVRHSAPSAGERALLAEAFRAGRPELADGDCCASDPDLAGTGIAAHPGIPVDPGTVSAGAGTRVDELDAARGAA